MNPDELQRRIECCRPTRENNGSADAEWSALRDLAAQDDTVRQQMNAVRAWDAVIARAMHDVRVPDGLEERLLQAVQEAEEEPVENSRVTIAAVPPRDGWWNRWPVRVAAAAVSLAAIVLLAMYVAVWSDTLTSVQVAQAARQWIGQLDEEGWQRDTPPVDEHLDGVLDFPLDGWQRFAAMGDSQAIAYRATIPPARSRAFLMVIKTRKGRLLPSRPPRRPDSTTGNVCIGVWKRGDHLYVLAVAGTRQTYGRLLKTRLIAIGRSPLLDDRL